MKRFAIVALAALFVSSAAIAHAADPSSVGRWSIATARSDDQSRVQLRLEYASSGNGSVWNSSWSNSVALADAGITADRLRGPMGPVSFTIQREPGTFNCVGSAGEGSGAGQFTYAPNARFDDALASRGMGRPSFHESLELAITGATLPFIDRVRGSAQHVTIADVVRVMDHGVNPRYIDELAALGYKPGSLDDLVRLRDHGVSPDFIRAVQQAGYKNLSAEDLVRLADHGVREKFIADMRAAGFTKVTADELVTLRDHGVTADFVSRLKAHGYNNLSVRDLIRLRDAGI
ncbi:MAG TPA: hypothetical protein VFE70_09465 [Candidatus Elarobacter sp.]|nr:hypothetical protein [Candidatus Elarobacter sp.]